MITKMKKLTFLVYHKEYENFLKEIRELGVIHVSEKQQGTAESPELQDNIRLSGRLTSTLNLFDLINTEKTDIDAIGDPVYGFKVLDEVEELQNEKSKLNQQLQIHIKDENTLAPWGDFLPQSIRDLHDAGMDINFYICQDSNYKPEWEELYNAIIINKVSSKIHFITITRRGETVDLDAEHIKLPRYSLTEVRESVKTIEEALKVNEEKLSSLAKAGRPSIKAAIKQLHQEIEFSKVLLNTQHTAGEKLMLLEGWIPEPQEANIAKYLESNNVYFEISNPVPEDDVPIQFNNKGFFSWFEPICRLYMLPKYGELDLTPFFAPFFMVFFGLCLGDMGYGLLLLAAVTIYRLVAKNISATIKPILSLVQILSFSTIVCGLLTGGFFGYSLYDLDWPIVQRLKNAVALDNNEMFQLSLILGVIQIMFGMILKVVNQIIQFGFRYAVATLGWVILFLSIIAAFIFPNLLPMFDTAHLVIMGVAALMIFLYNSPEKNVFINIGLGFWDTYNMATGLLGDVLSYVRLFALGLSGGILASVFNSLASGLSPDNVIVGPIVFILIFVIGHAINIFMNVLGAIVHPMRLTFVEFFKNAGYEGGGTEYKPFSK
jgi:Archaeal/vacuolar-type H+-ATPase subunit I